MKEFTAFLESIKEINPTLIEGIKEAYTAVHEGLATEEALDEADMKLEQNTEEKIAETQEISDVPMENNSSDEDISIEGLDELIEE